MDYPCMRAKQRQYQSHAVIQDVNNSDEEKSSTELQGQNKTVNRVKKKNSKKKRQRYNPARDPNFDLNSPEFINPDRRNSAFTKSELMTFNNQLHSRPRKGSSPSPEVIDESDTGNADVL